MLKVSILTLCVIYARLSVGRGHIPDPVASKNDQVSNASKEHNETERVEAKITNLSLADPGAAATSVGTDSTDVLDPPKTHIPPPVSKTDHVEDSAAGKVSVTKSEQSDQPQTAAGEMAHGMTGLTDVEKEFYDHFKGDSAGHWFALRSFEPIHLVDICQKIFRIEKGYEIVAHYLVKTELQHFKVQLKADEVENLMTDVIECIAETIPAQGDGFERTTFYVAEGNSPNTVFQLNKSRDTPDDKLKVFGKVEI